MQTEQVVQCQRIKAGIDVRRGQQGLRVGSKAKTIAIRRVIQWLNAHAVACQKQRFFVHVPNRKRKHSQQMLGSIRAPFGIGFQNDFGIAIGKKVMPPRLQFLTQFGVVVNCAIEHQCQT